MVSIVCSHTGEYTQTLPGGRKEEAIGVAHLIRALTTWFVELMREMDRAQAVMHGDEEDAVRRHNEGVESRLADRKATGLDVCGIALGVSTDRDRRAVDGQQPPCVQPLAHQRGSHTGPAPDPGCARPGLDRAPPPPTAPGRAQPIGAHASMTSPTSPGTGPGPMAGRMQSARSRLLRAITSTVAVATDNTPSRM